MKYKVKIISVVPTDWEDTYIIETDERKEDLNINDIMNYIYEYDLDPIESNILSYNFGESSEQFIQSIEEIK